MKRTLTALLLLSYIHAHAQKESRLRLNAYANYMFDDKVDSYYSSTSYYNGTIKGGFQWGLGAEFMARPDLGAEISYYRLDTKAPTTYYDQGVVTDPVKTKTFDLAVNYILLNTTRYFLINNKVEPYVGAQAGVGILSVSNPANGNGKTVTKFAWGFRGGTNIWLGKTAGIKLQASLQSVTQAVGGGLYFGTGGVSTGLSSYSSVLQFALGGGLVFRFNK